jgi:23S rRNA (pseudouridine1915-N3)-methyltransferase
MKTSLIAVGNTHDRLYKEAVDQYASRLKHYTPFEYIETQPLKIKGSKPTPEKVAQEEYRKLIQPLIEGVDFLVLFDEKGKNLTSKQFATWIEKRQVSGLRHLAFIIGGPYGFAPDLKERANALISLSAMTLTHQMVRLLAAEQIYRAHTILRGEPYHHDQ